MYQKPSPLCHRPPAYCPILYVERFRRKIMRSFLLPLVAAALSVSALHADPVTVSAAIYGDELLAGCSSAPYCWAGDPAEGRPYASTSFTTTALGDDSIQYSVDMNFRPQGDIFGMEATYGQGHVFGTVDLPDSWTSVTINSRSIENGDVSADFYYIASFDPTTYIPNGTSTYGLTPGVNTIQIVADAQGTSINSGLQLFLTVSATPASTPEPASAALVALPILAFGFARWRAKK
jgi:hypothetical protein